MHIVVLAGGIGGARFLMGVRAVARASDARVTAVVNVGDDLTVHGLRVCPDLDSVMYTLGGGADPERGWGRRDETWVVKEELAAYGAEPTWFGLGDRDRRGTNHFAHERLTRRVIGGHWTWSPRMMELAARDAVEAYVWPSGAISLLLREIGARRPGLLTRTGLHTFVDPRHGGGRANAAARDDLVALVELDGREFLHYRPLRVDIGLIRGTEADRRGNIGCAEDVPR